MIKAIIFDMDGVIANTQIIQSTAESIVFGKIGIHMTAKAIVGKYSGFKDIDMFRDVLRQKKIKRDANKLIQEKWRLVYKEVARLGVPAVSGAIELAKKLVASGYVLSLASSTNLRFIQTVLNKLKIEKIFQVITSGDEVKHGKPDPKIFLITAKKLGIPQEECLVIEDAPTGVKAAKGAAMKCIAITTSAKKDRLKDADRVIDSFDQLTVDYIKSL